MVPRLDARIKYDIETFDRIMAEREASYGKCDYTTTPNMDELEVKNK